MSTLGWCFNRGDHRGLWIYDNCFINSSLMFESKVYADLSGKNVKSNENTCNVLNNTYKELQYNWFKQYHYAYDYSQNIGK